MKKDLELLEKIYNGTCIGSKSLNAMLPGVKSAPLRRAIITQINEYDRINSDAKAQIFNLGQKVKAPKMTSAMASIEAKMNVAVDASPSHLAEVIIKGSNMGIINLNKEMNKSQLCNPNAYNLGRRLLKTEENNISRIKSFL